MEITIEQLNKVLETLEELGKYEPDYDKIEETITLLETIKNQTTCKKHSEATASDQERK